MSDAGSPTDSPKIRLVLLWHMHQPFYKDMVTGEYRLPWVRLHALKDYYGMVKLLDEFPGVHQNFNLVPSLVAQIQDYVSGQAHDPFFDLVAKPASELNAGRPALRAAVPVPGESGQHDRALSPVPRVVGTISHHQRASRRRRVVFRHARLRRPASAVAAGVVRRVLPGRAGHRRSGAEGRRLHARRPAIGDCESSARSWRRFCRRMPRRRSVAPSSFPRRRTIIPFCRCSATPMSARSRRRACSLPTRRFRHPDDATLQIQRALDSHEALFGVRPQGLWPSEGSVSEEALKLARRQGIEWMATDEGVLGRSLDFNFARYHNDRLHVDGAERLYNIYRYRERRDANAHGLSRSSPVGPDRLCLFRNAGAGRRQSSDQEHQGIGAAGTGSRAKMRWCRSFSTAKMPGNITRSRAANFCGASTTPCSAMSRLSR